MTYKEATKQVKSMTPARDRPAARIAAQLGLDPVGAIERKIGWKRCPR